MLQQAVEAFLKKQGWIVESEGHVVAAMRGESELVVGFVGPGEASAFAIRTAESSAALAAALMEGVGGEEELTLQESGINCFPHQELEDLVLADWLDAKNMRSSTFIQFLNEV